MCSILKELHRYVHTEMVTLNLMLPTGESKPTNSELFQRILLGGDQLTAACAHNGCSACLDHGSSGKRLCGILLVMEDWHKNKLLESKFLFHIMHSCI